MKCTNEHHSNASLELHTMEHEESNLNCDGITTVHTAKPTSAETIADFAYNVCNETLISLEELTNHKKEKHEKNGKMVTVER